MPIQIGNSSTTIIRSSVPVLVTRKDMAACIREMGISNEMASLKNALLCRASRFVFLEIQGVVLYQNHSNHVICRRISHESETSS